MTNGTDPAAAGPNAEPEAKVLDELGIHLAGDGETVTGRVEVTPAMWVPGTTSCRISVLVAYADLVLGLPAIAAAAPEAPVTLELAVELAGGLDDITEIRGAARLVRAGRSIAVTRMDLTDRAGRAVGFAHGLFAIPPDVPAGMPTVESIIERSNARRTRLEADLTVRVACTRTAPGVAALPYADDISSYARTTNGGLLALPVEEAALAADPMARTVTAMCLRYLRPVREATAVATATTHGPVAEVEVIDASTGTLAVLATTRVESHPDDDHIICL